MFLLSGIMQSGDGGGSLDQWPEERRSFDSGLHSAANADEHEILWFSNLSGLRRSVQADVKVARENQTSPPDASTANKLWLQAFYRVL